MKEAEQNNFIQIRRGHSTFTDFDIKAKPQTDIAGSTTIHYNNLSFEYKPLLPKKLWLRNKYRISFDITPDADGYYTIQCREIPALITQAKGLDQAIPAISELIIDAI